jgi:uncharacterized membrane protein YuzA (DUF378 family)
MFGAYLFAGIAGVYVLAVLIYMHPWNKKNRSDEPWHRQKPQHPHHLYWGDEI